MKKLKHIISWTIWSLLTLYALFVILLQLPYVQGKLGDFVSKALSEKLGTEVQVGRIYLGFSNRFIIDDVIIHDQRQEELLTARRMSVRLDLLPLLDKRIAITSAQLFGTHAQLYRDSVNAVPNYQFILDALSSPEKSEPSNLNLTIGSLIVRRLSIDYNQKDAPQTPARFNPQHVHAANISAHILLRTLTPDSLNLNVKRIALQESSGLSLTQLSFKVEANRQQLKLSGFSLQMPHSMLQLDTVRASYVTDSIPATLSYEGTVMPSTLALSDLASLLPQKFPLDTTLNFDASISGTLKTFVCKHLNIHSDDDNLTFRASGNYQNSKDWSLSVEQLAVSDNMLQKLHEYWPSLPQFITRLGNVYLNGDFHGNTDNISAQGMLSTGIGRLSWHGSTSEDVRLWNAHVDTDSLQLDRLLDNPAIGQLIASLDLNASQSVVDIKGEVPSIELNGYSYRNVTLDGTYSPTDIAGKLKIDDPNLQADVEGRLTTGTVPHIQMTGFIGSIAPQAIHLSDRWGDAIFSAVVDADFSATSISDAEGTIDLDDFIMAHGDTAHYHLDNLHIRSGYDDELHFLRLSSDFGEALLKGQFDLGTLPASITSLLPMLPRSQQKGQQKTSNDFALTLRLTDSRWMQQLLGLPLELNGPLNLDAELSDESRRLDVTATIPAFNLAGNDLRNATVNVTSNGDSAQCLLHTTRYTTKETRQSISLSANATNEQLSSALSFSTPQADYGSINTITRFYVNDEGQRETHVRVMPSLFIVKNATWELEPCDIVYSDKRLLIDLFSLHHDSEHLIIDGIASDRSTDSLMLDLNGVDVAYLLDLVNFHSVSFGGKATGRAYVSSAFGTPQAWADITVDDFLFLEAPMGTLEAHADWNNDEGQIDLEAAIDGGTEAQTFVDGYISPRHGELDLGIRARGTSLGFVHSFTKSFMSHIEGSVFGDVRVYGPLKQIDLSGEALVSGVASIIPLGTTYHFQEEVVNLTSGSIGFQDFHIYDRDNHHAELNGAVNHNFLKDFTFDFSAQADNLLAYDFPRPETGAIVGGTVWVDGSADMTGRPGEILINCDVTPTPSSIFYYNAANPDAVNAQNFITWGTSTAQELPSQNNDNSVAHLTAEVSGQERKEPSGDVRVNLRINATPDATLYLLMDQHSDDHIALKGNGALRASFYDKGAFQLFGTYNVEGGNYSMTIQNILKKNFTFQPGSSIVFGGDPFMATLNLKAQHTVNGVSLSDLGLGNSFTSNTIRVNCLMNIVGTAGEPRVEFDLEMPTVNSEEEQMIRSIMASEQELNQQVVYLLGIGRFYTQNANNAATQTYGQTELAMQSLLSGTVSSQINQLLSQVIKTDDWNFGANISTGNEGWHNAEYEGIVSGRMLNNRLLINGQFGYRDNATQASPSFIGDFDIRYLLTPTGNLALKAYNQTNDRYFTHSSLNTQGVGIIMKKDFNGLSDLFTHRKRKRQ